MLRIEHIGIAVRNLEVANQLFSALLATKVYKTEEVTTEQVKTSFLKTGETKIELLEATSETSVIAKFLEKKGEGIHHIAFEVENIEESMQHLESQGFILLNQKPKKGADNKWVCFLHPKSTHGVLIELCQEIS
ncbi:MAG: methylmalonyl-CoA epimerase [Verrucomicrobia bacterium]|nr:methylmalonyl-CoA epimerase [Cytophagales bacterium]